MSKTALINMAHAQSCPNLKRLGCILIGLMLGFSGWGCKTMQRRQNSDILFQTSTIDALLVGVYDGEMTFEEIRQHGDFGVGTFNGLDGEMVALDGDFFQVKFDGTVHPVSDTMKTPFSVVTFFESDHHATINGSVRYEQLKQLIDSQIPTENVFYAVKIDGDFKYVKTRSVPKQRQPYPPLVDVVKRQALFEFHNVRGTVVGVRTPAYAKGISVPGYHLHFITEDKTAGGHVLECQTENVEIELDYSSGFFMVLPAVSGFGEANLTINRNEELWRVEN
jgi:acetolactate decarboxylase